jgi:HEAT repeat protein
MSESVSHLIALLASAAPADRIDAAEKLARLETAAQPAAVALVRACALEDDQLRDWVVAALEALGPPDEGDVANLAAMVDSSSLDSAYWAVTLLGRLQDKAAPAVPQLAGALANHAEMPVRERAAWALGRIGPSAAQARDALTTAAQGPDARLAKLAGDALARL